MRIGSSNERVKRLITGKQNVIRYFTDEFPKTKHLLDTVNVDIIHYSVSLIRWSLLIVTFTCVT